MWKSIIKQIAEADTFDEFEDLLTLLKTDFKHMSWPDIYNNQREKAKKSLEILQKIMEKKGANFICSYSQTSYLNCLRSFYGLPVLDIP